MLAYAEGPCYALSIGYCTTLGTVGSFLGPLLLGLEKQHRGEYVWGLMGLGAALLVAGFMCFFSPRAPHVGQL